MAVRLAHVRRRQLAASACVGAWRGAEATKRRWQDAQEDALAADELGPLESPTDAARWLAQIALAVATGRLGAQEASVIQRCVTTWLNSREMWAPPEELPVLRVILSDGENEWDAAGGDKKPL